MIEWCGWLIVAPPLIKEIELAIPPVAVPSLCRQDERPPAVEPAPGQRPAGQEADQSRDHPCLEVRV